MDERRTSPRFRLDRPTIARLYIPGADQSHAAWVQDISLGGASLVCGKSFEPFRLLRLELSRGEVPHELPARVVHAEEQPDGTWRAGCEFLPRLTSEDLDSFRA